MQRKSHCNARTGAKSDEMSPLLTRYRLVLLSQGCGELGMVFCSACQRKYETVLSVSAVLAASCHARTSPLSNDLLPCLATQLLPRAIFACQSINRDVYDVFSQCRPRSTGNSVSDKHKIGAHLLGCRLGRFSRFPLSSHFCSHPITALERALLQPLSVPLKQLYGYLSVPVRSFGPVFRRKSASKWLFQVRFALRLACMCVIALLKVLSCFTPNFWVQFSLCLGSLSAAYAPRRIDFN